MNDISIIKEYDKTFNNFDYFLDGDKGILVDLSKIDKSSLKLSEGRFLADNVTSIDIKDNYCYIYDYKYLDVDSFNKYLEETFNELSNGVIKSKTYITIKHQGKYINKYKTYKKLLDEIVRKNYEIVGIPIEQYINGSWNENDEENYITNIMIPIKV